ncbi:MAG: hypothetical protein GY865_00990 [candidate division Zixibacteria bacterium]|nr:hypothetical protein [candidate division Zixibacteria bacterium]
MNKLFKLFVTTTCLLVLISCAEKNPPRDEIPLIKNLLGQFEKAVREHNPAGIDSLIIAEAYEQGYHSTKILGDIFGLNNAGDFIKFGSREFSYTKDIGFVKCLIVSDTTDAGFQDRPVEIVVIKKYDQWFLKQFDLK